MVTLNLTLLVELGLFLVFLWMMRVFVFKPLLRVMDEREARVAEDKHAADARATEAKELEREYGAKVAAIHRASSQEIMRAHRKAQEAHANKLRELKQRTDANVASARKQAKAQVAEEREKYGPLVDDLVQEIAKHAGLEGRV